MDPWVSWVLVDRGFARLRKKAAPKPKPAPKPQPEPVKPAVVKAPAPPVSKPTVCLGTAVITEVAGIVIPNDNLSCGTGRCLISGRKYSNFLTLVLGRSFAPAVLSHAGTKRERERERETFCPTPSHPKPKETVSTHLGENFLAHLVCTCLVFTKQDVYTPFHTNRLGNADPLGRLPSGGPMRGRKEGRKEERERE